MDANPIMDLEEFRQVRGLSYRKLAELLGLSQGRTAQAYARGEFWPDADRLEAIVACTGGLVTLNTLHARRLAWLRENHSKPGPRSRVVKR
jgi:transcriptional regulator with XRE-family HTH domain